MSFSVNVLTKWDGEVGKLMAEKTIEVSILEAGLLVESTAKVFNQGNVDTGRLIGSITTRTKKVDKPMEGQAQPQDQIAKPTEDGVAYVGTNVFYAPFIEYGTVRTKGRAWPFMRPAFDLARGKTLNIFEQNGRKEFA